jgi:hypothetical protein
LNYIDNYPPRIGKQGRLLQKKFILDFKKEFETLLSLKIDNISLENIELAIKTRSPEKEFFLFQIKALFNRSEISDDLIKLTSEYLLDKSIMIQFIN